jgi:hypothetical protein
MTTTFYTKNLTGEIKEISYNGNIDEISNLITKSFGKTPLHEPIWIDNEGCEFVVPRNGQTLFILYRYIPVDIEFIPEWKCYEDNEERKILYYDEITLLIESKSMQNLYEEIVIFFYVNNSNSNNIFYSVERSSVEVIHEDYGSNVKQLRIPDDSESFISIKDLFLSFRNKYQHIPEGFFQYLAECSEKKWIGLKDLKMV